MSPRLVGKSVVVLVASALVVIGVQFVGGGQPHRVSAMASGADLIFYQNPNSPAPTLANNSCGKPTEAVPWNILSNKHGWSICYPASWQADTVDAEDKPEDAFQPVLRGPKGCDQRGEECGFIQIGSGWRAPDARQAALSAKDALLETISPRDSRYVLLQQGDTTLGGQPAYFITYRMKLYENYPNGVIFKEIETKYRNQFYFIVFNEEGKDKAKISTISSPDAWILNPTFERIASSLKFKAR